jgi:hypothetical protein
VIGLRPPHFRSIMMASRHDHALRDWQCAEVLMAHCRELCGATELNAAICIADGRHAGAAGSLPGKEGDP